jgi:hypothetical protein
MRKVMEVLVMTRVEMNERMQDLRNKVAWLRTEIMAIECEMDEVKSEYRKVLLRG